jgi:hypothetical protein
MHTPAEQAASAALASEGEKLHTDGMHVRRTTNKGYIAKHELVNEKGHPPQDGQKSNPEYSLANHAALMAHMNEHMGPLPETEDQEPPQAGA